jgi:Common central domain of tyrosinase
LEKVTHNFVRRDLNSLTERDVQSLKAALRDLQLDTTNDGWASLASMHGAPARCKDDAGKDVACCIHGMPTFPHWHRLFTLQVIQTLFKNCTQILFLDLELPNTLFLFCIK